MIRTCSVVIISQNDLFTLREQIYQDFLFQIKNNRGVVPVILPAIVLPIDTKLYSLS
jgi:hypothetical protein